MGGWEGQEQRPPQLHELSFVRTPGSLNDGLPEVEQMFPPL